MTEPSLVAVHPELESLPPRRGSPRARLLEGITQAVAEKGYAGATVADAVSAARVSRGTFYAEFASKEECFLEAYRHGTDVLVARIREAVSREPGDWRARLRAGLRCYLQTLVDEPVFARAHLFEVHAAGARAGAERDAALVRFAERYRSSFRAAQRERPGLRMPSDEALFVLVAGVDQFICMRVRTGEHDRLADLAETLTDTAVAFLEGATAITTTSRETDKRWT
jgi:AcrR family transcriptional regulator